MKIKENKKLSIIQFPYKLCKLDLLGGWAEKLKYTIICIQANFIGETVTITITRIVDAHVANLLINNSTCI